jgi:hypothetical protein
VGFKKSMDGNNLVPQNPTAEDFGAGPGQQERDFPTTRTNGNGDGGDARERLGSGERGIEASAVAPLAM